MGPHLPRDASTAAAGQDRSVRLTCVFLRFAAPIGPSQVGLLEKFLRLLNMIGGVGPLPARDGRSAPSASTIGVIMDQTRTPDTESSTQLLTLTEAAARLRAPVATLRYWRHLGAGPDSFRLGRRVMYRRDDIDRWITAQHDSQAVRPR